MIKIVFLVVALIAIGVFVGLELWTQHQHAQQAAYVKELIGSSRVYEEPHTPWSPVQ